MQELKELKKKKRKKKSMKKETPSNIKLQIND